MHLGCVIAAQSSVSLDSFWKRSCKRKKPVPCARAHVLDPTSTQKAIAPRFKRRVWMHAMRRMPGPTALKVWTNGVVLRARMCLSSEARKPHYCLMLPYSSTRKFCKLLLTDVQRYRVARGHVDWHAHGVQPEHTLSHRRASEPNTQQKQLFDAGCCMRELKTAPKAFEKHAEEAV